MSTVCYFESKTGYDTQSYPITIGAKLTAANIGNAPFYAGHYDAINNIATNLVIDNPPIEKDKNNGLNWHGRYYAYNDVTVANSYLNGYTAPNGLYKRVIYVIFPKNATLPATSITTTSIPDNCYIVENITAPNKLVLQATLTGFGGNRISWTLNVKHVCDKTVNDYSGAPRYVRFNNADYILEPIIVFNVGDDIIYSRCINMTTCQSWATNDGTYKYMHCSGRITTFNRNYQTSITYSPVNDETKFSDYFGNKVHDGTSTKSVNIDNFTEKSITPYKTDVTYVTSNANQYNIQYVSFTASLAETTHNKLTVASTFGLYFTDGTKVYKPIIDGGIVTGYSDDLTALSDIDTWNDFNHNVPDTPPTPPTPTGDDIDDMTLGYDILDNGMIKYYQITVGDLDKVSTVIENMSYAKTIKSVWDTLNSTTETNKLDTILNTLRTWGVSADNLLPSIVSLKSFGISTSNFLAAGGTKAESIVLNGVDCETNTTRILASSMSYHIGDYPITGKFGDAENPHFLDYAPYTHLEIYIPFCGTVELPSKCMYNTVNVYILGDIFSGSCVGVVKCKGAIVATKSGMIGVDTPLTSNGNGMKSNALMSGIMNSVGIGAQTILSGATGNMGGIMSGATAGMSNTSQQIQAGNENYTRMIGNVSDKCAWALPHQATIKIVHPIPNYGENYDRTYGKPVCKSRTLTAGDGFTIVDNPIINGNMTLAEKIEIENYLKSGVIL